MAIEPARSSSDPSPPAPEIGRRRFQLPTHVILAVRRWRQHRASFLFSDRWRPFLERPETILAGPLIEMDGPEIEMDGPFEEMEGVCLQGEVPERVLEVPKHILEVPKQFLDGPKIHRAHPLIEMPASQPPQCRIHGLAMHFHGSSEAYRSLRELMTSEMEDAPPPTFRGTAHASGGDQDVEWANSPSCPRPRGAGIPRSPCASITHLHAHWIPACAGMTNSPHPPAGTGVERIG